MKQCFIAIYFKFCKTIPDCSRIFIWKLFNCRKILTKQFFHEPKDAGLLHIVQELEPGVEKALKTSAKFNAISLYRKIASIVSFVVDRKESDEEKGKLCSRS